MKKNPSIAATLSFVTEAHLNRLLKPSKSDIPYHWHLLRVMLRLGDTASHEEMLVALLHDVLEDTTVTKEELRQKGYSEKVISDVVYCSYTEFPKLSKQAWMKLLHEEAPTSVIRLKYADISDNLGFERMRGLYEILKNDLAQSNKEENSRAKTFYRNTKNLPILTRIHTEILNKHPYSVEPKVYAPYYDSLNFLLKSENNSREHEIKNIQHLDFTDRLSIKELLTYLPNNERKEYMTLQNLSSWTMNGKISLIKDRSNNEYLAVLIDKQYVEEIQQYLINLNLNNYIDNQQKRDDNSFHITVINAADYSYLKKNFPEHNEYINEHLSKDINFFFHGVGKAEGKIKNSSEVNTTFFAVLENSYLDTLRENLNLKKHDFHLTIGFDKKDVHGVKKDRSTIIVTPEEIHQLTYSENKIYKTIKP